MTNKMTYSDALRNAIAAVTDEATKSRLEDLRIAIEKRSNSERKPSKAQLEKQEENKALAEVVFKVLSAHRVEASVAELKKLDDQLVDLSSPKLTAVLKILIDQNRVSKDDSGRVAKYIALD